MLEKAFTGSKRYWGLVLVLVALIGVGFIVYLRQLAEGLGITGMSRDVTWGLYIAQFTFLVGVAASAVMVVLPYYLHNYKAFGKLTILGEFLAVAAVTMCALFIMVDLGAPYRGVNILRYPSPRSVMFWDMVSLGGYLLINLLIAWTTLSAERRAEKPAKWIKPFIYLSIPWAVSIHTVTAFLYCGLSGRPFWMTAILAPRFLASAFAAGPSLLVLLILILRKYTKFDAGKESVRKLGQIITYAMLTNIFFILLELFTAIYSNIPEHLYHFKYMYLGLHGHGWLVPFMWTSAILAIIAALLLVFPKTRNNEKTLALACVATFFSLWLEKGLGMVVTGFIPSTLHTVTEYHPTGPEIMIAVGVWSIGFLILTVLYKVAVSVREAAA